MSAVLINGISARSGGGKSILTNFLRLLSTHRPSHLYVIVVPTGADYSAFESDNVKILPVKNSASSMVWFYVATIRKLIRRYHVSVIFNLADLIIPVRTKQIYLFDWPYAVYPESIVWKQMTRRDRLLRRFKLFLIKQSIHLPVVLLAQTHVAESRLRNIFGVRQIMVVSNAVSLDNIDGGEYRDFHLPPAGLKFLYLTKYYPHKNIEIFLPVGRLIKQQKLGYTIVITVDAEHDAQAKKIVDDIKAEGLDDTIINVGSVDMKHVPSLYHQCDALLMPSLLESFSGTFVEAMYHSKPIFSTEYDFAQAVCGDGAFYFNPLVPESIINTIKDAYNRPGLIRSKIDAGREQLGKFPTWKQAFDTYVSIIETYV